jgi:hypothetical protein
MSLKSWNEMKMGGQSGFPFFIGVGSGLGTYTFEVKMAARILFHSTSISGVLLCSNRRYTQ